MTRNTDIEVNTLTRNHPGMAAAAIRRQQQREQTLEWVSLNALATLTSAWCKAKSSTNAE